MVLLAFIGAVVLFALGFIFVPRIAGMGCLWTALGNSGFFEGMKLNSGVLGLLSTIFLVILSLATVCAVFVDIEHIKQGTFFSP